MNITDIQRCAHYYQKNYLETFYIVSTYYGKSFILIGEKENFPHLRSLSLTGCRATETLKDLTQIDGNNQYNGKDVGLHVNISQGQPERAAFLKLLTWDN